MHNCCKNSLHDAPVLPFVAVARTVIFFATLFIFTGCACRAKMPAPEVVPVITVEKSAQVNNPIRGLDILGLAMQDAKMIADELPQGFALGVLEGTFGSVVPKLESILKTGKVSAFRSHLINWTCRRNHNCEASEPDPSRYLDVLGRRARAFESLHSRFPSLACYLSPLLEYDERGVGVVQQWISVVEKAAPSCTVLLSPSGVGSTPANYPVERHGNSARGFSISNDGNELFDSDSAHYCEGATRLCLGFTARGNLRVTGEKTPPPPSKRKNKLARADVRQMVAVLQPITPKPTGIPPGCKTVRELQGKELWKTNAEDYGVSSKDPRGNKPLLISKIPPKNKRLSIISPSGKEIGCATYFDTYLPYGPGWERDYVGSCSKDTPVSLMKKAGGEWIFIKHGTECLMVNAIRRTGITR